ncbi:MAG: hypothetical protein AMJ92_12565 [candidate division Zixibacteria bacterium SM23_81]|nr:MAG: hypothetical protein AMJ92_12565 [candidate division Zixibacteria bacterium SM23_81]
MRKNKEQVVLVLGILLVLFVLSCSPKPVTVVKSYVEAYNAHDLEKLLSLHSEQASFEVVSQVSLKGKDELRDLAEHDFALNIRMSLGQCRTQGDTVICELTETNEWLKAAGIEQARYSGTFVIRDGLIVSIKAKQAPETERAFRSVLGPLLTWASKHRSQLVEEMMPQGKFVYTAENARKSLLVLQEFKEELMQGEGSPIWKKIGE